MRRTWEQLDSIRDRVRPMLGYFSRLENRMEAKGFTPDDRLFQRVLAAQDDLHRVTIKLHYRACDGGVGR